MPTWPSPLPQYVLPEQFREIPGSPTAEVPMDAGAPKTFGTGTDEGRVFNMQVPLTNAQVDILDAFYRTDLRDGETEFDWVLPEERTATKFAFLARPRYQHVDGDTYTAFVLLQEVDAVPRFGFRSRSTSAAAFAVATGASIGFQSSTGTLADFGVD